MATEAQKKAKAKYNASHYSRLLVYLPIGLAKTFREVCAEKKVSMSSVIKDLITKYLEDSQQ